MRLIIILVLLAPCSIGLLAQDDGAAGLLRHQASVGLGFSKGNANDFSDETDEDVSLAYHLMIEQDKWAVGIGPAFNFQSLRNGGRLAAVTALGEFSPGTRRLRPVYRLRGGLALPIGSDRTPLASRAIGTIIHPSVGLRLLPPTGSWGEVSLDVGYRFTDLSYTLEQEWGAPRERDVVYRRLTFTLSTRL